jgi:hypothetical protein
MNTKTLSPIFKNRYFSSGDTDDKRPNLPPDLRFSVTGGFAKPTLFGVTGDKLRLDPHSFSLFHGFSRQNDTKRRTSVINYVQMTNFRGVTNTFGFCDSASQTASPRVQLRGRNGSKKTTVREAIAFAFTGRDSQGTANPTHLITMGESSCEVTVQTRKGGILRRTLGKRGGSLQLMLPGGAPMDLTQTQFEQQMLCPADVFLSVLHPGYLFALPKNRQSAVLSYALPPVDRVAYMRASVSGELLKLDYSKRPDLLQKQLAEARNAASHELAVIEGQLEGLRSLLARPLLRPVPPPEEAIFDMQEALKRQWENYDIALAQYTRIAADFRLKREENVRIQMKREMTLADLESLREIPMPEPPQPYSRERPLQPMAPTCLNEEERDRCPECGQAVGLKHREMVRAHNDKLRREYAAAMEKWEKDLGEWRAGLSEYEKTRAAFEARVSEVHRHNVNVKAHRHQFEEDLRTRLVPHQVPPTDPPPPEKPAEEFSKERYFKLKEIVHNHYKALGAFDRQSEDQKEAAAKKAALEDRAEGLRREIENFREHEEALRLLPGYELTEQKAHLRMSSGYELRVEDGLQLFDRTGCPYELLSRGQRMHADFEISLKINSLLQRKVGMIFLDDFDLADWKTLLADASDGIQIFSAHVEEGSDLEVRLGNLS